MKKASRKSSRSTAARGAGTPSIAIQEKGVKEFERGVTHLHRQNYAEAVDRFQAVIESHPLEKELLDRAHVYLRICKGMMDRKVAQPKKPEDNFYFGVIKANEANYDEAVKYLDRALQNAPKDEKVHYVMASTLALKGERQDALKHLREAIELNATNRIFARNDPDFEPLRGDEDFQNLVHPEEM
jgi:tetratricopeptide (TPR) repeat protein